MTHAQARREWIRRNHPDVGGDAGRFAEGLAAFDAAALSASRRPRIVVVRRQTWLDRLRRSIGRPSATRRLM